MPRKKITNVELEKLVREGNSISDICKKLGVTRSAVWKRLKALDVVVTQNVALHHAGEIVERKINAIEQLQKINRDANEILDLLMRWNRGDEEALQMLESQVATKKIRVGKHEEFIKEIRTRDPRELALKAMQEIRSQLHLQLDIHKTLYDMAAVAEFQKEVLEAIQDASPELRDKIVRSLQERRVVRSTLEFS
jgi:transposase